MRDRNPKNDWLDVFLMVALFFVMFVALIILFVAGNCEQKNSVWMRESAIKWDESSLGLILSRETPSLAAASGEVHAVTAYRHAEGAEVTPTAEEPDAPEAEAEDVVQECAVNNDDPWVTFTATAYCPCSKCCGKWSEIAYKATASGVGAVEGRTIAMDESYPFGTRVWIDGLGEFVCEDRGSAIQGARIDIYFESHEDALAFGMRDVLVKVIQ